mmetsp:Transcript_50946/g.163614  ORF Transcript_50946/g.163614 Transcript_50946/m.163614 type:complete len:251 (+) Transcript_50946:499-1251(+)
MGWCGPGVGRGEAKGARRGPRVRPLNGRLPRQSVAHSHCRPLVHRHLDDASRTRAAAARRTAAARLFGRAACKELRHADSIGLHVPIVARRRHGRELQQRVAPLAASLGRRCRRRGARAAAAGLVGARPFSPRRVAPVAAVRRAARRAAVGGGLRRGCARRGGRLAAGRAIRRVWGDEEDLDGPRLRLEVDLISPLPRLHPLIRVGHLQRGSRRRLDGDDRVGGERGDVADVLVCDKGMLLVRRVLRQRA